MNEAISVAALGTSGSGKTVVLGALGQGLIQGSVMGDNGVIVSMTGSDDDPNFRDESGNALFGGITVAQRMAQFDPSNQMSHQGSDGSFSRAAAGTVEMQHFFFDWGVGSRYVPMKLMDFKGGNLSLQSSNVTEDDIQENQILTENLGQSEVVFLLLDGIKLAQYRDNASKRKEKTGANRLTVLMKALMKHPKKGVTVMILVTKTDSDQIPADLKENNFRGLCNLAIQTMDAVHMMSKTMVRDYAWTFGVIPVTALGENNSVTKYIPNIDEYYCAIKAGADIKQKNVDVAFMYGMRCALAYRVRVMDWEISYWDNKITAELGKMNLFNSKQHKAQIDYFNKQKAACVTRRDRYNAMVQDMDGGFASMFGRVVRFGIN